MLINIWICTYCNLTIEVVIFIMKKIKENSTKMQVNNCSNEIKKY
jgi:hypothetical protein